MSAPEPNEFIKDPEAVLPFGVDWTDWLEREGIASPVFTWFPPDGLTASDESTQVVEGRTVAVVWLAGGDAGRSYRVTCRVDDASTNKRDERSIFIRVRER